MVRAPYIDKITGLKKGAWSEEEDSKLRTFVQIHGHRNWRQLPRLAGLARCGKSCRLRWMNYLKPGTRRGNYTSEEDDMILALYQQYGTRWALIASELAGRTDNEIKNHWHSNLWRRGVKHEPESMGTAAGETSQQLHQDIASNCNYEDYLFNSVASSDSSEKSDEITDALFDDICSPDWAVLAKTLSPLGNNINPFSFDTSYDYVDTYLHQQEQLPPLILEQEGYEVMCPDVEEDGIITLDDLFQ